MENAGSMSSPHIKYCPFEDKRLEEIEELLVQNFAADEITIRLCRDCEGNRPEEHRRWIRQCLGAHDWRVCRLAVDADTDRAVGVCVSHVATPDSANPLAAVTQIGSEASELIENFISQVAGDYDIFKTQGVDKALCLNLVTVDRKYRRRGISHELRRQCMELGRQAGCQAAIDTATSPYTRRSLAKLGFHQERFLPFKESLLASSEKVDLSGCGPDDGGALMVCRL